MFNSFKFLNERYMSNFSSKSSLTSFTSLLLQDISLWTSLLHCFTCAIVNLIVSVHSPYTSATS